MVRLAFFYLGLFDPTDVDDHSESLGMVRLQSPASPPITTYVIKKSLPTVEFKRSGRKLGDDDEPHFICTPANICTLSPKNLMDSHNNSMAADWRTQLLPESRHHIVNKIMETIKRHLPISGPEGLVELRKIAVRFEEKVYSAASSQSDYLRKISLKMLTMELPFNCSGNKNPPAPAPTRHSDVVDSQEVDQKGQQSSDEEEFDDVPDDDEYDTEDSFIDDAELEPVSPQQPGQRQFQRSFGLLHLMTQQPQSRIPQLQQEENQVNLIEKMNIQGPATTMQSTAVSSSQQGSISLSAHVEVENGQQKMVSGFQPSSDLESASGHTLSSLPQDMVGSLQQNTIDPPHLTNNSMRSHNVIQLQHGANSLELNSMIPQEQHLKQQKQEQQLKNEYERRQAVQKLIQQQQMQQLLRLQQQQQKQQQLLQLQALAGGKTGMFPQPHLTGQHETAYPQLKTGPPCPDSSPQLLHATSLQLPQHSSLQTSPWNLPSTVPKEGTSLQFAPYPCIGTHPPISVRPSPILAGSKKLPSFISSIPNAGNIGHQETVHGLTKAQYLSIGTPGMLNSPLLPEFSSVAGKHGNASQNIFGKLNATERPPERLTKAVLLSLTLFLVVLVICFSS
ncbi:hypothetical protein MRB53_019530 [Persea americana]|uniref:Uncharacterized protein n=1 Tax=Persea americana TaxID=3435 RepID=A0ACC2KYM5_PERAE|nr:hypothetical protein MRB53_019530 [Persea americana]